MSLRQILILLLTLVYFGFCYWFVNYTCENCDCSRGILKTASVAPLPATDPEPTKALLPLEPILFDWTSSKTITTDSFPGFKDYILAQKADDKSLEIIGYYHDGESAPEGYANMGLARADAAKKLFLESVPDAQIITGAKKIQEKEGIREKSFKSTQFSWIANESVEEIDDKAVIYFPYNSSKKEVNPQVDEYLAKVAERVKKSGEKLRLTGHTDSDGSDNSNNRLSRARARLIRTILMQKGVKKSSITIVAKGESDPARPNDSDANKRLNRRVEVEIL